MSIIPSIILSAVLSCGGNVPAEVQQAVCDLQNSNCANDTYYEKACDLSDFLCNSGVDIFINGNKCSLDELLNNCFGCGNSGNDQTAPVPEATPVVPEATPEPVVPEVTPEPVVPEVTPEPVIPTAAPTRAPQATQAPQGDSSYAYQVVELVNQERAKYGLSALSVDETLMRAAQTRAVETVRSFAHTRPDGSNFSSVLSEYGVNYRSAGENIAYGQRTPQEVVTAWMNSSGHRANILNSRYGKIGVGCYKNGSTYYWSQLFTD